MILVTRLMVQVRGFLLACPSPLPLGAAALNPGFLHAAVSSPATCDGTPFCVRQNVTPCDTCRGTNITLPCHWPTRANRRDRPIRVNPLLHLSPQSPQSPQSSCYQPGSSSSSTER